MSNACSCSATVQCFASRTQEHLQASSSAFTCIELPTRNGCSGAGLRQLQHSSSNLWQPGLRRWSRPVMAMAGEDLRSAEKNEAKQVEGKVAAAVETKFGSGAGFGAPSTPPKSTGKSTKSKKPGPAARQPPSPGPVRRTPPAKALLSPQQNQKALQVETAVVVSLGLLGLVILLEGLVLAASGLLPQEWDSFLVDVLYPSYTPTVGLFLLGAAGYGVFKVFGSSK